ncbi:MAG TPA: GTPase Era [Burkholderiales bacterium]|nr:GTPase Era [Burkholderiales bacterium]
MASTSFRTGMIAIVGRPNVGKSTLLNRLVGQRISITSRRPQTTRYRITGILTQDETQYIFVDTPGFQLQHNNALNRALNRCVAQTIQGVDAVLLVVDALQFNGPERQTLDLMSGCPILLVINKIDKLTDKKKLLPFIEKVSKEHRFAAIVPVSAKKNLQLNELLQTLREFLPENPPVYSADEITDCSERFMAAELIREKIFRSLGEEVPYAVTVMVDDFVLEPDLRRIQASIIVDKSSQKAIIIGAKGGKLKTIATQARVDMEKLFGGKVFLEVWVRVRKGWADNIRMLKALGYE